MTNSRIPATYERIADLPVVIDGYTLDLLSRRVSSGFRRFTTVFALAGAGHHGVGEDVTYEAVEHRRAYSAGPVLPLAGTWTLEAFSRHLDRLDTFPDRAARARGLAHLSALGAGERRAGSGAAPGRPAAARGARTRACAGAVRRVAEPRPGAVVRAVAEPASSMRVMCGSSLTRPRSGGMRCWNAWPPAGALTRSTSRASTRARCPPRAPTADLYRRVARALPDAWLEDPDLSDPAARVALHSQRHRVTWDAPIHSAADIAAQPWPARTVNIKPSRFGTLRALLDTYDHCATHGIGVYGGGQYELGPGRGQAQYLAALFHPDAPNDLAPAGFDDPVPPADVPCSPMILTPAPVGFGAQHEPRTRADAQPGSANSRNPAYERPPRHWRTASAGATSNSDNDKGCVMKIEVFDPAMCCSTGVCGPSVPPALARFAGDLEWLARQGVDVTRYNLTHEPQAFVASEPARTALAERGEQALPLILLDGEPVSSGRYPYRSELAGWAGVPIPQGPRATHDGGAGVRLWRLLRRRRWLLMRALSALLENPTRVLFFTGKGGMGKTTLACATAVALVARGRRVLIVSTDPASNLDEVLGTALGEEPRPVAGITGLDAANIDPEAAAREYRERAVGPYRGLLPDSALASMEESLSGACTVEIAAFDTFAALLGDPEATAGYDHVIFDTAPTGHTLRLLALPAAWSGFIDTNTSGVSCLGPLAGLQDQRDLYAASVRALGDPQLTTLVLVSRPERTALAEAERTRAELAGAGMRHQVLALNGTFDAIDSDDDTALAPLGR